MIIFIKQNITIKKLLTKYIKLMYKVKIYVKVVKTKTHMRSINFFAW